jgi:hypothetical protein
MTATTASPQELVALATTILDDHESRWTASWARAVALLTRQALEDALDDLWCARNLVMDRVSTRAQLLCLAAYLKDDDLTSEVRHAWGTLSRACHHHPYELAPTATELRLWINTTKHLVERVSAAVVDE